MRRDYLTPAGPRVDTAFASALPSSPADDPSPTVARLVLFDSVPAPRAAGSTSGQSCG